MLLSLQSVREREAGRMNLFISPRSSFAVELLRRGQLLSSGALGH